jgi:hypothetical protein
MSCARPRFRAGLSPQRIGAPAWSGEAPLEHATATRSPIAEGRGEGRGPALGLIGLLLRHNTPERFSQQGGLEPS